MNDSNTISGRLQILDGWRGLCILFVLAAHLLPLGPNRWQLNLASGIAGMAVFFTLSGFLITSFLLTRKSIIDFLIRRFFRIIPLAWVYMAVALFLMKSDTSFWLANFLFYANWPPMALEDLNGHLWSLCVEMQFYVGIALLVFLFRKRWIFLIPLICISITAYRTINGAYANINTYYRIDEILAGSILALIHGKYFGEKPLDLLGSINPVFILLLFIISCHPGGMALNYFRPYLSALLVGSTLVNDKTTLFRMLNNKILFYIATISYALYVVHPLLAHTWLGNGEGVEKYMKRPLLFLAIFLLAHISTFYYEKKWILLARNISKKYIPIVLPDKQR